MLSAVVVGLQANNHSQQGGTSGVGAAIALDLATRGAQIILLTQHAPTDPFLAEYIEDLRDRTSNNLIYAEQVDLSSLHSIRLFATKWLDNTPPRRLDMIVLCADTMVPYWGKKKATVDGLEEEWMVNYLSNFHLLSLLSPSIRAQPPDRDVRIIFSTCSSYMGGTLELKSTMANPKKPSGETKVSKKKTTKTGESDSVPELNVATYSRSKLATAIFAQSFQKHLQSFKRPDNQPSSYQVLVCDPGYCRTPGFTRWITGGSIPGLLIYLLTYPLWYLILKSPTQGAQTYLKAAMEATLGIGYSGGRPGTYLKECRERDFIRREIMDEDVQGELWKFSEQQIEAKEKEGAVRRALEKKVNEELEKREKEAKEKKEKGEDNSGKKEKSEGSRRSRKAK